MSGIAIKKSIHNSYLLCLHYQSPQNFRIVNSQIEKTMEIDRAKLIDAGVKYIYQLDNFPKASVENQISRELNAILDLNRPKILNERLEYFGIGKAADYLHHWLETDEGYVLAGIRHLGGNKEKPFVYIWASFKIKNINRIIKNIESYFKKFNPKSYHFWLRPDCNDLNFPIIQQRFIARIPEMTKYNLDLDKSLDFYDWYRSEYEKFHKSNPEYIDRITVNSKEAMEHCLDENLLFLLRSGDKKVGLIAGTNEIFLDRSAIYLDEILIAREFRGKGYAKKLLGSFINLLNAEYFICHIDLDNLPSTKTALRSGQAIFSQECSIKI